MAEYIKREAAIKAIEKADYTLIANDADDYKSDYLREIVESVPAADVVPVVHAKWIHTKTEEDDWGHSFHHWHCSACGWFEGSNPEGARKYCSGCGAKMEGVVDNA